MWIHSQSLLTRALTGASAVFLAVPLLADTLHVRRGEVKVTCPMTVGGSFEAKSNVLTGRIEVTPGGAAIAGSIAVDLSTLDTGIALRNQHLTENYLEVGRGDGFAAATLSGIILASGDPATFTGKTTFKGSFVLHGQTREVSGPAEVRRAGDSITVEASFPVSVSDFQIPKPSYLGVGVKNEVKIKVSLDLAPVAGEEAR